MLIALSKWRGVAGDARVSSDAAKYAKHCMCDVELILYRSAVLPAVCVYSHSHAVLGILIVVMIFFFHECRRYVKY